MKKHIPNLITCCNALCGTLAIFMVMNSNWTAAAWLILIAMVFDFFDGLAARLLHVKSELGKELDSLADMVSFGVVPAVLAYSLIQETVSQNTTIPYATILPYISILIVAFSAYRLAKFNLDSRQVDSFIGIPTPANALFWVSLIFSYEWQHDLFYSCWGSTWLLIGCILVLSYLLIAEIPMFSLKFKNLNWKNNRTQYIYFATLILLGITLQDRMLSFIIPLYILINGANFLWSKFRNQHLQNHNREKQ